MTIKLRNLHEEVRSRLNSAGIVLSPNANLIYVDSGNATAGASKPGNSPQNPLDTIDGALTASDTEITATNGDVVVVMPGHAENSLTASITMDIAGVTILGLGDGTARPQITASGTIDAITITAANCVVAGLYFNEHGALGDVSINVAAANARVTGCHFDMATVEDAITVTADGDDVEIDHNKWVVTGAGPVDVVSAITVTAADVFLDKIECRETVGETDEQFDAGIVVSTAAHQCHIKDFKFTGVAGDATLAAGILVSAVVRNLVIEDPWIVGDFLGACINLSAAATTARIIRPVLYQQDAVVEECILADSGVTGTVEHARLQSDINTAAGFDNIITAAAMAVFDIQIVNNPGENSFVGSLSDLDVSDALSQARVYSTAEG